jgi:hypothetical protein
MVKKQSFFQRLSSRLRLADPSGMPVVQDAGQSVIPLHLEPLGSAGTTVYSGYPSEEYLQSLQGRSRADIFDQMRRGDTQVKMCLSAVKNPIRSATFEIEPASEEDRGSMTEADAEADADLIRHILFRDLARPFKKIVSEALTVAEHGHAVFEIIHKPVVNHPQFGTYVGLSQLAFRSQRTIERWNLDPDTGCLDSITQYAYGDLNRNIDIPARFLLVMNLEMEGSNYEGISLLRPCYGPWKRKDLYLKLNAIGIEKFAIPTPIVKVPSAKQNTPEYDTLVQVLESYMSHEKGYITLPEGWEISLEKNAYDPEKVDATVDKEDTRMAKAFLANFLELGMNSVGSYALSNDLSDFMLAGVEYVAGEVLDPFNTKLIPELIQINRGPRQAYPKLKVSGISDKAGKELSEMLKALADSKYIKPDDPLEDHLRKRIGLPPKSTLGQRDVDPPKPIFGSTLAERIRLAETRSRSK